MGGTSDPETGFLEQLGQRVRTMRALRGMSRKVLARVSGISERYIAQLEAGRGNVSIVLLRRVSNAMGAHLEDLIPAAEPSPDWAVIRDLLRKAQPTQIAQAKDILAGQNASMQRLKSFAGIALIGYSVLLQGAYTRPDRQLPAQFAGPDSDDRLRALQAVAAETGRSPNQVLIAWMRQSTPAILPIIAGSRVEQLAENISALDLTLPDDQMLRLTSAGNPDVKRAWLQPS